MGTVVHHMNHVNRLNVLLQIKNEAVVRQTIWKIRSTQLTLAKVCQLQEFLDPEYILHNE